MCRLLVVAPNANHYRIRLDALLTVKDLIESKEQIQLSADICMPCEAACTSGCKVLTDYD